LNISIKLKQITKFLVVLWKIPNSDLSIKLSILLMFWKKIRLRRMVQIINFFNIKEIYKKYKSGKTPEEIACGKITTPEITKIVNNSNFTKIHTDYKLGKTPEEIIENYDINKFIKNIYFQPFLYNIWNPQKDNVSIKLKQITKFLVVLWKIPNSDLSIKLNNF